MKSSRIGNPIEEVKRGIIVQQVNAQGVMGSGFAKAIREKWPQVFEVYARQVGPAYTQHHSGAGLMGQCYKVQVDDDLYVANIVGQQFFGKLPKRYTSYDALDDGFRDVAEFASVTCLDVHYPLIGCGLGGGDWSIVSAIIDTRLDTINHTLWELPK